MSAQMNDAIVREFRQEFDENREPMTIEYATQRLRIALDRARAAQSAPGAVSRASGLSVEIMAERDRKYGMCCMGAVPSCAAGCAVEEAARRDACPPEPRAEAAPRGTAFDVEAVVRAVDKKWSTRQQLLDALRKALTEQLAAPRAPEPEAGDSVQARTCPWCGKGPQVYGKTDVRCRDANCPGHVHWRSIEAWNSCAPRASEDGEVAKSPSVVYDAPRSATPGDGLDGSGVSQPPREADPRPALLSAQAFHAALMARYQAECEACSRCQGFGATAAATNHAVRAVTFLESANLVAAYEFDAGQLQPLTAAEFAEFPVQGRPPHDAPPSSAVKETGGLLPCEGGCTGKDSPSVDSWGDGAFSVSCWTCKRSTQKCATREEAIAAWNRRSPAPSDVSADEVERFARGLFEAYHGDRNRDFDVEQWHGLPDYMKSGYRAEARYALTHRSAAAKVPSVEECERAAIEAWEREGASNDTEIVKLAARATRALFARDASEASEASEVKHG